jgi:hypothetical protein
MFWLWRSGSPDTILKIDHLRTIHGMFVLYWHTHFRGRILNILPYAKTMSADVGHFAWRSGSLDIILKVDHSCHVCFKLTYWFQKFKANVAWMVLKWSTSKITSSDPDLHAKWLPSANIVLTWDRMGNMFKILHLWNEYANFQLSKLCPVTLIHAMFALNWLTGFRGFFFKTFSP